jgi:hypothetical protein
MRVDVAVASARPLNVIISESGIGAVGGFPSMSRILQL